MVQMALIKSSRHNPAPRHPELSMPIDGHFGGSLAESPQRLLQHHRVCESVTMFQVRNWKKPWQGREVKSRLFPIRSWRRLLLLFGLHFTFTCTRFKTLDITFQSPRPRPDHEGQRSLPHIRLFSPLSLGCGSVVSANIRRTLWPDRFSST
jgi:hypothetical protein